MYVFDTQPCVLYSFLNKSLTNCSLKCNFSLSRYIYTDLMDYNIPKRIFRIWVLLHIWWKKFLLIIVWISFPEILIRMIKLYDWFQWNVVGNMMFLGTIWAFEMNSQNNLSHLDIFFFLLQLFYILILNLPYFVWKSFRNHVSRYINNFIVIETWTK